MGINAREREAKQTTRNREKQSKKATRRTFLSPSEPSRRQVGNAPLPPTLLPLGHNHRDPIVHAPDRRKRNHRPSPLRNSQHRPPSNRSRSRSPRRSRSWSRRGQSSWTSWRSSSTEDGGCSRARRFAVEGGGRRTESERHSTGRDELTSCSSAERRAVGGGEGGFGFVSEDVTNWVAVGLRSWSRDEGGFEFGRVGRSKEVLS